jgi:hypothetical protein
VQVAERHTARRFSTSALLPASAAAKPIARRRGGSLGDVRLDHPLLAPFRETPAALAAPRFLRHVRRAGARRWIIARFDDGSAAVVGAAMG